MVVIDAERNLPFSEKAAIQPPPVGCIANASTGRIDESYRLAAGDLREWSNTMKKEFQQISR